MKAETINRRRHPDPTFFKTLYALAFLLAIAGCHRREPPHASVDSVPLKLRTEPAELKKEILTEDVVGTVQPKLRASIEAKLSARIEKVLAEPGQNVKSGDVLVLLDARELQARLDQSVAQRDQFARDAERLAQLLPSNAVSRQEVETAQSRHRVAVATVTETETLLGYTKVTAPFPGVITRKLADVGDLASPGKPLLEMENPAALRFEASVPESLISRIEPGATLAVFLSQLSTATQGTVSEIAPAADPASRTFLIKLDLASVAGLHSGIFGRVAIPIGEAAILRVPATAIVQRGQMELLFIATNNQARMRLVKTGKRAGDRIEIVSGLDPGERVILEDPALLRDGQPMENAL